MGLHRAGYEVHGVDTVPQPNYPFQFSLGDALEVDIAGYDLIWASPPCQRFSVFARNQGTASRHPNLVTAIKKRLQDQDTPWIIENVPGAPLRQDFVLCGTTFGLRLVRHRVFEVSWVVPVQWPVCVHRGDEVPVYGRGTPAWYRERFGRDFTFEEKQAAMGIDWMTLRELVQAVPPAYAEYLASRLQDPQ